MAVFIIAEAGVNHNGDLALAHKLIETATAAGADAVKFQTFKANEITVAAASKAAYQKETTDAGETQQAMLRRLELPYEAHFELKEHCAECGIKFLSTPFDFPSLDFLISDLGIDPLKISSGEMTNAPFLLKAARMAQRIILSTGMSTLPEVGEALSVLSWAIEGRPDPVCRADFASAFALPGVRERLAERVTLLHCTTQYPTPYAEVNLKAMDTIAETFGVPVGLSDHTPGVAVSVAAVARGATVIEKHFTLDRNLPGPDHKASLDPDQLADLVASVRAVEAALGDGFKRPSAGEIDNARVARKSLVASRPIAAGEVFGPDNLTVKRPGTGASPMLYWDFLGRVSSRAYDPDSVIDS